MSVIIQMWKRLAPSRTKKLSTSWVMILRLTGRGKVAHRGLCYFFYIAKLLILRACISRLNLSSFAREKTISKNPKLTKSTKITFILLKNSYKKSQKFTNDKKKFSLLSYNFAKFSLKG